MKKAKNSSKGLKNAHTPNTKYGMGDYYGSGVRNPTGRIVDGIGKTVPKGKLNNPPRGLA